MTQDLIARALAGDEAAARELHDAHYPAVLRLAYMLLQNLQDAEDATQDAFVYAFEHLAQYDPARAAFATWLKVIVTSRCRDRQRRWRIKWLSLQALTEAGLEPEDETPAHQPDVVLDLIGVQQAVWEALQQVPRKSRQALILRYYGGLSYPEMAQALGCSISTAKSRVVYGHQALARLLAQEAHAETGYHGYHIGDVP
jgi:RNA polymerase sigma-70 factor (ECF subfamily)